MRTIPTTAVVVAAATIGALTAVWSDHDSAIDAAPLRPRLQIDDLVYAGAFRLSSDDFGVSNVNYAAGPLAFNSEHDSLFIAGHLQHNAIGEFDIPAELGFATAVVDLPIVDAPRQDFVAVLDVAPTGNPEGIDRIDGMLVHDGQLVVNAENWYDASGQARDTTLVVRDADDLDGEVDGFFEMSGGVHAAGYMSSVPDEWHGDIGAPFVTGWASNTSIVSRHSVGPTLFGFDPAAITSGDALTEPDVSTITHMDFPFQGGRYLDAAALDTGTEPASDLWNFLAKARFGFIAPGSSTFVVLGSIGGTDSGIGYKITQDDGNVCGGYCSYAADDRANAYWLFDVNEILAADDVHLPRPYAHGTWSVPFDGDGSHPIIGGTFDALSSTLYLSLSGAAKVGTYDEPPLIVAFRVESVVGINGPVRALDRAERAEP